MSFESSFFEKRLVDRASLLTFGFVADKGDYNYQESFMDGAFLAMIRIDESGTVSGRVLDVELSEDYDTFRSVTQGSFVGEVREAYGEILARIAEACFIPCPLSSSQGNRLVKQVADETADTYDYPFAKHSETISYRHPANRKWYALFLPVSRGKVTGQSDETDKVTIVTVKVSPDVHETYLAKDGIYPAYHMNKQSWVSIILDDTLSDAEILDLLTESRRLVAPLFEAKVGDR